MQICLAQPFVKTSTKFLLNKFSTILNFLINVD